MSALESLAFKLFGGILLVASAWIWHSYTLAVAEKAGDKAGYARALAAGKALADSVSAANLKTERQLRAQNAKADAAAHDKDARNAETLAAAQSRVRTGADSLRIATRTIAVLAANAGANGPAAAGSAPDQLGEEVVPEVAATVLGLAADTARLVRKYERLEQRFDACQALTLPAN